MNKIFLGGSSINRMSLLSLPPARELLQNVRAHAGLIRKKVDVPRERKKKFCVVVLMPRFKVKFC